MRREEDNSSEQLKPVRVAVIGLGWVALNRHIPNFLRHNGANVVGVVDRKSEYAETVAQRFQIANWAGTETGEFDWIHHVDAVSIATPPDSHYALAKAMLLKGKHVLLEKPMAMQVEQGDELARLAREGNRVLAVVHNFQFARSLQALAHVVERGELGEVRSLIAMQLSNPKRRLPCWYDELPLGLFYDESPHLLYLLRKFAPEDPEFLAALVMPSTLGKKTPASVNVQLRSGSIPLNLYMNLEATVSEWHFMVVGSKRMAIADLFRDILTVISNDESHQIRHILRSSWEAFSAHWAGFIKSGILWGSGRLTYGNDQVVDRFVKAVQKKVSPEGLSARDGLFVLEMQHRIMQQGTAV